MMRNLEIGRWPAAKTVSLMRSTRTSLLAFALASLTSSIASAQRSADDVWRSVTVDELESRRAPHATAGIHADRFSAFELEPSALAVILAVSPEELALEADDLPVVLTLPRPDGSFERFAVAESPVMHEDLGERMARLGWPMKTYRGTSLDRSTSTVRFDWGGPAGFHAMVHSPDGNYFIDPYWLGDTQLYSSYYRRDYRSSTDRTAFRCRVESNAGTSALVPYPETADFSPARVASVSTGGLLRTYRLAVAATGEYTTFHGGSAAMAQAAVTTTVNRVNMVYERDLSVRLVLVADNLDLIYTDAGTDPYTNSSCSTMRAENQLNVDMVIGSANYDIGHVFSTGGGGFANFRAACGVNKAKGCTGQTNPLGDPFDIDFVAHELGHQLGARHTWTGSSGSCSAGQFRPPSAYEPGSGSTIMAYAGICGADDLQANSDDHFHRRNLDEMGDFVLDGGSCFSAGGVVNPSAPSADAGPDFSIPMGTPFELSGGGGDADGDPLTFNWEQFDLGQRLPLSTGDDGTQPIFRSWPSTGSATRVFPRLADLVAGALSPGETLPVTERTMNFRLTVRDNHPGGGRESDDAMTVTSTTTAGPFEVTAPNGGEDYPAGSAQTVTWDVAGTAGGTVGTPDVDILMSADGGLTYPVSLVEGTPNDGSETVILPTNVSTANARFKVKGAGNIFFDISDADSKIEVLSQCSSPFLPIADLGEAIDLMAVAGGRTLADLNVYLEVEHTRVGDLAVVLEHVDNPPSVVLLNRPGLPATPPQGCEGDDIMADFDDEASATGESQCSVPTAVAGAVSPFSPLSDLDGQDVGGTWRLIVIDLSAGESGTLRSWCLHATFDSASSCLSDRALANLTLSGAQTHEATATMTLGPTLSIDGTDVVVNAPSVVFLDGVEVGGTFQAGNTTTCS